MFLRILDRLEEIIIACLIGAATLLIFVAVVQRYLIGVPFLYPYFYNFNITWAQELCIYMFVWMAKFGAAYGCLLYTSPSPRDGLLSRMPSSA